MRRRGGWARRAAGALLAAALVALAGCSESPTPEPTPTGPPEGYIVHETARFQVAVPEAWKLDRQKDDQYSTLSEFTGANGDAGPQFSVTLWQPGHGYTARDVLDAMRVITREVVDEGDVTYAGITYRRYTATQMSDVYPNDPGHDDPDWKMDTYIAMVDDVPLEVSFQWLSAPDPIVLAVLESVQVL